MQSKLDALAFVVVLCACALLARIATGSDEDFALNVARVAVNEGALFSRPDAALVWQTVRVNAKPEKRAEWLRKHSPRVHLDRPCYRGNCRWTPYLTRSGAQPLGLDVREDLWTIRIEPVWQDILQYVDFLVWTDRVADDPCPIPPRTWGGSMDREGAIKRGLYPIGCATSQNDGYVRAGKCYRDGVWVCEKTSEPVIYSAEPDLISHAH